MITVSVLTLMAWLYLVVLHGRFWSAGPELSPAAPRASPSVDVVVPARDEAALVADSVGSLLGQEYSGVTHVTLVDDGSTDGTREEAARVPDSAGRLGVIESPPRPHGWAGKLWAVAQGVEQGTAEWVLLTDADIVHDPRHLATLLAHAQAARLDMVSEMVALRCEAWAERTLIPAFVYFFQLLFPFARVNAGRIAAAAGGTILIRRVTLARAGGIRAIRERLIDDVALAAAVQAAGGRIWLGHTRLARSIRPYATAAAVWRMVARSAYVQLGCRPWVLIGSVAGMAMLFAVPPALAIGGDGAARWFGIASWLLMTATFVPTQLRMRPRDLPLALFLPVVALFYVAATIGSAVAHHRGRGVVWKSRAYDRSAA